MKWLDVLQKEVDSIETMITPESSVNPNYLLLGELPDHLKKLFTYCEQMRIRVKALIEQEKNTDSRAEAKSINKTICNLRQKHELVASIMWQEIKHEFQNVLPDNNGLALCKDWKVYSMEAPANPLEAILGGLK